MTEITITRDRELDLEPSGPRLLSSALHYESRMQVQRANFARKKSSSCKEKVSDT